jgi:hypothetical protein
VDRLNKKAVDGFILNTIKDVAKYIANKAAKKILQAGIDKLNGINDDENNANNGVNNEGKGGKRDRGSLFRKRVGDQMIGRLSVE